MSSTSIKSAPVTTKSTTSTPAKAPAAQPAPAVVAKVAVAPAAQPKLLDTARITLAPQHAACPKRPGSASRTRADGYWPVYTAGGTVAQALAAGATRADLAWDSKHGFITIK